MLYGVSWLCAWLTTGRSQALYDTVCTRKHLCYQSSFQYSTMARNEDDDKPWKRLYHGDQRGTKQPDQHEVREAAYVPVAGYADHQE